MGCGWIATHVHLPILSRLRNVEVTALVEPDAERRACALQITPRASGFESLHQMLEQDRADGVIITAPTPAHCSLTLEAMGRGLHVYLEKPIAATLSEGYELLEKAERQPGVKMTGFHYRFHSLFREARERLASCELGRALLATTVFTSSLSGTEGWRGTDAYGGVLPELGSHHFDLISFLFGQEIASVRAQASGHRTAIVHLELESGLPLACSFSFGTANYECVEIYCERGLLRVNRNLSTSCEVLRAGNERERVGAVQAALGFLKRPKYVLQRMRAPGNEPAYRDALKCFVSAIASGAQPSPDFEDGFRSLAVVCAAQESLRTGIAATPATVAGVAR